MTRISEKRVLFTKIDRPRYFQREFRCAERVKKRFFFISVVVDSFCLISRIISGKEVIVFVRNLVALIRAVIAK